MYNKAFLIGNLTRDPDLRYTPSGIPVARFAIAINRPRPKRAGAENPQGAANNDVDFIELIVRREPLYNKSFPCYVMKKNKNKRKLVEL